MMCKDKKKSKDERRKAKVFLDNGQQILDY